MDRIIDTRLSLEAFTAVKLCRDILHRGVTFPAGTSGTIVHVYEDGIACEVEFSKPAEMVLTLTAADIA